jgi:hypothetical protein
MVWDFTCPDTLAASHLNHAVVGPGAVANYAESRKTVKYNALSSLHRLVPVAVETLGDLDIGQRIVAVTGEPRLHQFLIQRLQS